MILSLFFFNFSNDDFPSDFHAFTGAANNIQQVLIFSRIFVCSWQSIEQIGLLFDRRTNYIQFLVGGFKHYSFSIIYGMSSFPLTFIFFRGVQTTNQIYLDHSDHKHPKLNGFVGACHNGMYPNQPLDAMVLPADAEMLLSNRFFTALKPTGGARRLILTM